MKEFPTYSDLIEKTKESLHKVQASRDTVEEATYLCAIVDNQENGLYETNMECLGEAAMSLTQAVKVLKEITEGRTI